MKRSLALVGIAAIALSIGTAAGVYGATMRADAPAAAVSGQGAATCRLAFNTRDDTVSAVTGVVASATMNKSCAGPVVGHFTTLLKLTVTDLVGLNVSATCTATGGFSDPCTVATTVLPTPGGTIILSHQIGEGTHGFDFVWPGLKRGVWRFDVGTVSAGGNGTYSQRTWDVEAFKGVA